MFYTYPYSKIFYLKSKALQNSVYILAFDLSRSTARSTDQVDRGSGSRAYPCARFTVDRTVDRDLPDWQTFALCIFGSTGRSTDSLQRLLFLNLRSTDRSTGIAVWTVTAIS